MKAGPQTIARSGFTRHLVAQNALDEKGFVKWVFEPGMRFGSAAKWWKSAGRRSRPHEGLDLHLYQARQKRILILDETTRVPALFAGTVVNITADFLGTSIMVQSGFAGQEDLFWAFGHLNLADGLAIGAMLNEGEILGTLAAKETAKAPCHLHVSAGRLKAKTLPQPLDWAAIGNSAVFELLDPLGLIIPGQNNEPIST